MNILHTKFLIHWTGKDFHKNNEDINDNITEQYVARLKDVLSNGLFMRKGSEQEEKIYDCEQEWFGCSIARTCFTEIKLSMAEQLAKKYGKLGIGVNRKFVIERYGNPVFYMFNGTHNNIALCSRKIRDFLNSKNDNMLREFEVILSYFKKMNEKNEEDLVYYDELEWRIAHFFKWSGLSRPFLSLFKVIFSFQ